MLQLQQTCTGYPDAGVQYLLLKNASLILYPSADAVIILDARTLALVRVLAFWEAFPGLIHSKEKISCISVDSGMKLVVAAMGSRLAAWSLSDVQHDAWRIHSSLILRKGLKVTSLDNRAGLLAVGCKKELSIYTLVLENDIPTWSKKWSTPTVTPTILNLAPSLSCIAAASENDFIVRLYSTTSGRQIQALPHPRPVVKLSWRRSQASTRDDLIMYSVTSDATLRVFFPVLDSPNHLQLHGSLDLYSSLPFAVASHLDTGPNSIFWLDRRTVDRVVTRILQSKTDSEDVRMRRLEEIKSGDWDLFLRILADGSILMSAVANIDRRPPTLLQHFTLQQSQPSIFAAPPQYLYVLPNPDPSLMTLVTSPPLMSMDLSPLSFFDARSHGLEMNSKGLQRIVAEESEILRFIRTPEGRGVAALRADGGGEVWRIVEHGRRIIRKGSWKRADFVVVLDHGEQFATYTKDDETLTLHSEPPQSIVVPHLESLFSLPSPSGQDLIVGITSDLHVIQIQATPSPSLTLQAKHKLPLPYTPKFILSVDPMAWGTTNTWSEHDVLLSISEHGELAFWVPDGNSSVGWRCTGKVRTGRTGFRKVRCSSAKKTVLIVDSSEGEELTIWDSTESEFASGLEYREMYKENVLDLDWSSTPDMQSILAVGYKHKVDILCEQRMTYFSERPGWTHCRTIDITIFTPYPISDSIWLAHGAFLVAAGPQMYLYSEPSPDSVPEPVESLTEYVARQNGPLDDYHPQMLLQCLLWDKVELVKDIIMNLYHALKDQQHGIDPMKLTRIPVERFLERDIHASTGSLRGPKRAYMQLFSTSTPAPDDSEANFNRAMVTELLKALEQHPLPHLTPDEHAGLLVLIQTTLEIDEQRRSLDSNGLRYLISMRSFYIINERSSSPTAPQAPARTLDSSHRPEVMPTANGRRQRLRYRDMIWAFHSESQEILLNASSAACGGKMTWQDARALGISLWLNSLDALKSQMEVIGRNEYMAGDTRDPTKCSIFYFALGKTKLVHGLWRQAAWHKEQGAMLKFLSNDFNDARWRTAALKNAFALLSKQRFEYAAAFFLLGGSLKDAVNVCIRQLNDFQLAVALARVVESSNDGPILKQILTDTVLPTAFRTGNRWLGSWAFWLLHRRDLATPLQDIAAAADINVSDIGEPHYDDPSLALLFSLLRSKTLQAAKGTSEISGRSEFNFVLQIARVFCRMGCHALALDLVKSWSFARPSTVVRHVEHSPERRPIILAPTPTRSMFPLEPALRRRSSILIDMDISSLPVTRKASPEQPSAAQHLITTIKEEGDLLARQAGIGSLLKFAKQDVQVPEFDMGAFF